jgi:putative lysine transport system ATP-binding protein
MDKIIEVRHLKKIFGENEVLTDINFAVSKGEVVCIIGASGSGKSTLLRCLNLLELATDGEILFHGENIMQHDMSNSVYRAKMGMVFQQFNLFSNLTVWIIA